MQSLEQLFCQLRSEAGNVCPHREPLSFTFEMKAATIQIVIDTRKKLV